MSTKNSWGAIADELRCMESDYFVVMAWAQWWIDHGDKTFLDIARDAWIANAVRSINCLVGNLCK